MKLIEGGVCAAKGFKAGGIHCGIRKNRTKRDIALIVSHDEGESWSEPYILLHHDSASRNLMCPSLLRLKNGNIGMMLYCGLQMAMKQ